MYYSSYLLYVLYGVCLIVMFAFSAVMFVLLFLGFLVAWFLVLLFLLVSILG